MSAVIGITFGNTTSSIAVATQDGKVDVIANPDGDRSIPSALSYVGSDEYHGTQAQNQLIRNAPNTVVNFRDYIGKKYEEINAKDSHQVGAPAIKAADGGIAYEITRNGNQETLSVNEITKRHFKQLKLAAEDYIGKDIEGVVITVPTDFTAHQREELTKVSNEAGLKVLQLINEPSAALLAHLSNEEDKLLQDKIYVVADFGGIRSDAAVISVRGGVLTILATAHDHGLGGSKLDAALAEFFAKEFEKKYKANPRTNQRSLAKLIAESVVVKKTLSNVQTSTCSIESLAEGFDFHTTINRLRYELTARQPLSEMTAFVEKVVTKAGLETLDIDEVLLVGGSSHTPKLASNVSFIFPESTVVVAPSLDSKAANPSELIARGAALQASLIESFDEEEVKESLQPVVVNTQHLAKPIGIKTADGQFQPILVAETAYPIKKSVEVTNGDSAAVAIQLFEGKRTIKETVIEAEKSEDPEDSEDDYSDEEPEIKKEVVYEAGQLLAELTLKDLKPNSKLEVIVNVTQDGTLHVSGRELKQGSVAVKGEVTSA
ncbi:HSP70-domain-containing protein [Suhomyces tanzawaensis NRRL Y-17324]|uniref:HSP70-domain-containing protein n=1 Tax=Suhomyces tanzawaensis NRRL Y-17324 TaxID=984487 RepID=A0A1E4SHP6_9ASCO|nr:HSP70-domain-containing protein [Suhomyces tanzawaensis NRRL Y-17324]ODV79016.1 HSP70-domain-containing protein [Suhomyces tanzawaensis NRRL Y-17324]